MAEHGEQDIRFSWLRDRWLWALLLVALGFRLFPWLVYPLLECIRDECIYRDAGFRILGGKGLTEAARGWIPAPGYPYMLAAFKWATDSLIAVRYFQMFLSLATTAGLYVITRSLAGVRAGRIAAALFAINPTIAWFTNTLWIETVYIFLLISAALLMMVARQRTSSRYAWLAGLALGAAILFRGVATYLPPFFVLGLIAPKGVWNLQTWTQSLRNRARSTLAFCVATVLLVAPYAVQGSIKHGGFMISDATMGHVLYLGNNDFPPVTFDYGNGMLNEQMFRSYLRSGRKACNRKISPVKTGGCEADHAKDWILDNPGEFVGRMPMRVAQLLNPNSFLTRHLRWGHWPTFPWWAKEGLSLFIVGLTLSLSLLGTLGAWARARGTYGWIAVGTTVYTVATIAVMYGMTRFRLPLEALWTVYLAIFLAQPKESLAALRADRPRLFGAIATLPVIFALSMWYLPTGFPMFW